MTSGTDSGFKFEVDIDRATTDAVLVTDTATHPNNATNPRWTQTPEDTFTDGSIRNDVRPEFLHKPMDLRVEEHGSELIDQRLRTWGPSLNVDEPHRVRRLTELIISCREVTERVTIIILCACFALENLDFTCRAYQAVTRLRLTLRISVAKRVRQIRVHGPKSSFTARPSERIPPHKVPSM